VKFIEAVEAMAMVGKHEYLATKKEINFSSNNEKLIVTLIVTIVTLA
jgi:hypothetical protein